MLLRLIKLMNLWRCSGLAQVPRARKMSVSLQQSKYKDFMGTKRVNTWS